jgi:UDP-N-acetylmuramoyl-tripeptide--D-alanyl-D-alanine ligase
MKDKTKAKILTYGISQFADLRATNISPIFDVENNKFLGTNFKIEREGISVPVRLNNIIGNGQVYAALSGAAVGLIFNMNLVEISEALKNYKSPEHRLNLIPGIKDTLIVDDTYNASPTSMIEAFEIIKLFKGRRKIGVLGDMLELGILTEEAHRSVGKKVIGIFDLLFIVGERAKFISDEALKNGFPVDKIFEYCQSQDAALPLQNILKSNDIILVKGSHAMQMEKIVEEIKI